MCLDLSRVFSLGIEFQVGSRFFFNTLEIFLHFHINFAFLPDLNMYFLHDYSIFPADIDICISSSTVFITTRVLWCLWQTNIICLCLVV